MDKLKRGDKVKIRTDSRYYRENDRSNPVNKVGIVESFSGSELGIIVRWPEFGTNNYDEKDLELVTNNYEIY